MSTRDLVLIALFAAIIAALGLLPPIALGFIPVPITAQSFGVMLAGAVLGARRGALSVALLLVLVAIGLPLLSGGRGGLAVFAGPTAGFLAGWVAGAYVTGLAAERLVRSGQSGLVQALGFFAAAVIGGVGVVYLFGNLYLGTVGGVGLAKAFVGSLAFIPGDLIKAGLAAGVARAVLAGYPLLPVRA